MNDTIYRQAAIDKINERQRKLIYCFGFENDMVKIMDIAKSIITTIPSAQSEIIRCRDCANYQTDWMPQTMPDGHFCFAVDTFMREDEFCSRAERREDEQDA